MVFALHSMHLLSVSRVLWEQSVASLVVLLLAVLEHIEAMNLTTVLCVKLERIQAMVFLLVFRAKMGNTLILPDPLDAGHAIPGHIQSSNHLHAVHATLTRHQI